MAHFVFEITDGKNKGLFLSTRKTTGNEYPYSYMARVSISSFDKAKLFNTAGAAKNSARQAGLIGKVWKVTPVIDYDAGEQ